MRKDLGEEDAGILVERFGFVRQGSFFRHDQLRCDKCVDNNLTCLTVPRLLKGKVAFKATACAACQRKCSLVNANVQYMLNAEGDLVTNPVSGDPRGPRRRKGHTAPVSLDPPGEGSRSGARNAGDEWPGIESQAGPRPATGREDTPIDEEAVNSGHSNDEYSDSEQSDVAFRDGDQGPVSLDSLETVAADNNTHFDRVSMDVDALQPAVGHATPAGHQSGQEAENVILTEPTAPPATPPPLHTTHFLAGGHTAWRRPAETVPANYPFMDEDSPLASIGLQPLDQRTPRSAHRQLQHTISAALAVHEKHASTTAATLKQLTERADQLEKERSAAQEEIAAERAALAQARQTHADTIAGMRADIEYWKSRAEEEARHRQQLQAENCDLRRRLDKKTRTINRMRQSAQSSSETE